MCRVCLRRWLRLQSPAPRDDFFGRLRHIPRRRGPSHEFSCSLHMLSMYVSNCWFSRRALSSSWSSLSSTTSRCFASASVCSPRRFKWATCCRAERIFFARSWPAASNLFPNFWLPVRPASSALTSPALSRVRLTARCACFACKAIRLPTGVVASACSWTSRKPLSFAGRCDGSLLSARRGRP